MRRWPPGWKTSRAPWLATLHPNVPGQGLDPAEPVMYAEWTGVGPVMYLPYTCAGDESDHEPATTARGLCERGARSADQGRPIGVVPRYRPGQDRGAGSDQLSCHREPGNWTDTPAD